MSVDWRAQHGTSFDGERVLVTGAAGFIGSHIVEALVELGARVVALDDLSGGDWKNLSGFDKDVACITASILDEDALDSAMQGCRYVLHQAALGSVPRSMKEPLRYYQVNVLGTASVLEAARRAGVQRIVFASSSSVYGNPADEGPKHEALPLAPLSPYAATKAACEHTLRAWASGYQTDGVCLRYFNIFGPRQNANSAYAAVIAAFAKAMHLGDAATIFGDGLQSRDFTPVWNAVHANLLATRSAAPLGGRALNVACGGRIAVSDLHRIMARDWGQPGAAVEHAPARAGDVRHSQADIRAAREAIGYAPIVAFEEGLASTVHWYREHLAAAG